MTTFSYPLTVKRVNQGTAPVNAVQSKVPSYLTAVVSVGMTGTAVGTTTIPLFVAPAGSRAVEGFIDVVTAFDNTANTNISLGVSGSNGQIMAATTANTAGRTRATPTAAMVSANAIVFSVDTTIQAVVSITTSVVTTGQLIAYVVLI